jgi:hypothetical protein
VRVAGPFGKQKTKQSLRVLSEYICQST